ncbi:TPA: hypothetical protein H1Q11_004767 [Salmonella enterica]|nr:hypothetical protein [Salmonella enterica]
MPGIMMALPGSSCAGFHPVQKWRQDFVAGARLNATCFCHDCVVVKALLATGKDIKTKTPDAAKRTGF